MTGVNTSHPVCSLVEWRSAHTARQWRRTDRQFALCDRFDTKPATTLERSANITEGSFEQPNISGYVSSTVDSVQFAVAKNGKFELQT